MQRIRTIKPDFWESENLSRVSRDARLLFIGLFNCCDDSGRTRAASRILASRIFPYDDDAKDKIKVWLAELERVKCIRLYVVDGETYLDIPKWLAHQKIDRPSQSKLPSFDEASTHPREDSRNVALEVEREREGEVEMEVDGGSPHSPLSAVPTSVMGNPATVAQEKPAKENPEAPKKYTQARIVLHALNEAAGRHYRETETNLDLIRCRLEEPGVTVEGCIAMIRRQVARWKTDPMMAEFLRPETLFNRRKFDSYYANRDLPAETAGNGNGQRIGGPNLNAHVAGVADRIRERREQWDREDPDAPPPGFEREPKLALPGLGANGNPPQG